MAASWPQLSSNEHDSSSCLSMNDETSVMTPSSVSEGNLSMLEINEPLPPLLNISLDTSLDVTDSTEPEPIQNTPFFNVQTVRDTAVDVMHDVSDHNKSEAVPGILVTNLHHTTRKPDMLKLFEECGEIVRCSMTTNTDTRTKEITILYSSLIAAFTAAAKYNGTMIQNQVIHVTQLESMPPLFSEDYEHRYTKCIQYRL